MLDKINSPEDLKTLTNNDLTILSNEIRELIIKTTMNNGGHLSSNLGVVELTISMHKNFNSPKDKLIFDISHQSYTHKILTGRKKQFSDIRKYKKISGFINENESEHDIFDSSHAGNTLSAALGMASKENYTICLFGDGTLSNGMLYESLNNVDDFKDKKIILILNDNKMSISPNVGSLSKTIQRITLSKKINKANDLIFKKTPKLNNKVKNLVKKLSNNKISSFFDALNIKYLGPFDGHNFEELDKAFTLAKKSKRIPVIHIITKKGKGLEKAENDLVGSMHGFKKTTNNQDINWSLHIANIFERKMKTNKLINIITPAMKIGSCLDRIAKKYPQRFFDVGIAESHALTFAAGMSKANKKPVVFIYSTFLQRALDSVIHDLAINNRNIIICVDRAGFVGSDGEKNHGLYDLSFLLNTPNTTIMQPSSAKQANLVVDFALENKGINIIRYSNQKINSNIKENDNKITKIKWYIITKGIKTIISYGDTLNRIIKLNNKYNLNLEIINALFLKPLDNETLLSLKNKKEIYVIEDMPKKTSLANQIIYFFNEQNIKIKVKNLGLEEKIYRHGEINDLNKEAGIDDQSILEFLKEK